MDIVNIEALIAQGKIVKTANIDPNNDYVVIGKWQPNNRKKGGDGNAYPSYAVPLSELLGGGGITGATNLGAGANVYKNTTGTILNFRSLKAGANVTINQNADEIEIIASGGSIPITLNTIPAGTGPSIADGTWGFNAKDIIPLTDCSNIGSPTNRVKTIFMCSEIDYATDLWMINAGSNRFSFAADGRFYGNATTSLVPSNAGWQINFDTPNRANYRANDWTAGTTGAGATYFKSRGGLGVFASVVAGDTIGHQTYIAVTGNNTNIPLAAVVTVKAAAGGVFPGYVAADWNLLLMSKSGTPYDVLNISSEGTGTLKGGGTNAIFRILSSGAGVEPQLRFEYEALGGGTQGTITGRNGLTFNALGNDTVVMTNAGVGIGNNVIPSARLHVIGAGNTVTDIVSKLENLAGNNLYNVGGTGKHVFDSYYDGGGSGIPNYQFSSTSGLLVKYVSSAGTSIRWDETSGNTGVFSNAGGFAQMQFTQRFSLKDFIANQSKLWMDSANGYIGIGPAYFPADAQLHVQGKSAANTDYAVKVDNFAGTPMLYVRNDNKVSVGTASVVNWAVFNTPTANFSTSAHFNNINTLLYGDTSSYWGPADTNKLIMYNGEGSIIYATNGNSNLAGHEFQTIPSGQGTPLLRMHVQENGRVGIGTARNGATARVHVQGQSNTNTDYAMKIESLAGNTILHARNDQKVYIKTPGGWAADVTLGVGGAVQMYGWRSQGIHRINYGNNDIQPGDSRPNIEWDNSVDGQVFITGIKNDDTWGIFCKGASDYGFEIDRVTRNIGISTAVSADSKVFIKGQSATSVDFALKVQNISGLNSLTVKNDGDVGIGGISNGTRLFVKGRDDGYNYNFWFENQSGIVQFYMFNNSEMIFNPTQPLNRTVKHVSGRWDMAFGNLNLGLVTTPMINTGDRLNILGNSIKGNFYQIRSMDANQTMCFSVKDNGQVAMPSLPTSTVGLVAGDLWVDTADSNRIKMV